MGEIARLSLGKMLDKKQATGDHPTPYLRNINVRWGSFNLDDLASMDIRPEELDRVLAFPGDVIACEGGEPGRAAVWGGPEPVALQKALHRIRPTAGVVAAFLVHWLSHLASSRLLDDHFTGTTIKHLPKERLKDLPLPLPPSAEQVKIVAGLDEHLSRLDNATDALRAASSRLRRFGLAAVSTALQGDWPTVALADHTVDQRYGSSAKASRMGEVPILRMGNLKDGRLDYTDLKYLPGDHPDLATCVLEPGDLIFNRTNSPEQVGKSAVFEGSNTAVAIASYLIRVRLDEDLDPQWAATTINSPLGRRYIDSVRTQQVGQANVNGTKLKHFPIPVPPIDVQRQRLEQLARARSWLTTVEDEIRRALTRAATLRRSILAAAFSGQLVPQDPADEPASVLLDRVRAERRLGPPPSVRRKTTATT